MEKFLTNLVWARGLAAQCWCDPRTSSTTMDTALAEVFAEQLLKLGNAAEMLWVVVANVDGGNWTKQSPEWQAAAARCRDEFWSLISSPPGYGENTVAPTA